MERAFLEVELAANTESGHVSIFSLVGARHLIGRAVDLPLRLDHDGVSRLHAALIRDPYDRWWIHDLGSTNGTQVNGTQVTQRLLDPGDLIQIGPYRLTFHVAGEARVPPERPRQTRTVPPPPDGGPTTTRIGALTPAQLNAMLTLEALACARVLQRSEDRQFRLKALCSYVIGGKFPGLWGAVVRVTRSGAPLPVHGPFLRAGGSAVAHRRVLESVCFEHRESLLRDAGPHVLIGAAGSPDALIASVLELHPDGEADVLFVALSGDSDPQEWKALLALLAESYAQSSEFWQTRRQLGLNAAIERELDMARRLQNSLVPRRPSMPGLDLAIGYQPSRWVSGDYADAVLMPDGRVLLTIADVCGKGLQAALVASSLHTLVHVLVNTCGDLAQLVQHANAYFCRYLPQESFVTMACLAVDVNTRVLECANLGHLPPLLINFEGHARPLQAGENVALGMMDFQPRVDRYRLDPNEVLFLYTDGLTEFNFGRQGPGKHAQQHENELLAGALSDCAQIIGSMPGATIDAVCHRISETLRIQLDSLMATDDAAFLLARLQPPQPSAPRPIRTIR